MQDPASLAGTLQGGLGQEEAGTTARAKVKGPEPQSATSAITQTLSVMLLQLAGQPDVAATMAQIFLRQAEARKEAERAAEQESFTRMLQVSQLAAQQRKEARDVAAGLEEKRRGKQADIRAEKGLALEEERLKLSRAGAEAQTGARRSEAVTNFFGRLSALTSQDPERKLGMAVRETLLSEGMRGIGLIQDPAVRQKQMAALLTQVRGVDAGGEPLQPATAEQFAALADLAIT